MEGTDCNVPWLCPFPEDDGVEKGGDVLVFHWVFERFGPCMHDILNWKELVWYIFDAESSF